MPINHREDPLKVITLERKIEMVDRSHSAGTRKFVKQGNNNKNNTNNVNTIDNNNNNK